MDKDKKVEQFNQRYRIGQKVWVRLDNGEKIVDEIRAPASVLGGHTPCAWLANKGCYDMARIIGSAD